MVILVVAASGCRAHTDPPSNVLPAESDEARFIVSGWHEDFEDYFSELVSIASHGVGVVLVTTPEQSLETIDAALDRGGADLDAIEYVTMPMDTFWVRDFGPWGVRDEHGAYVLVDATYDIRPQDDQVPRALADLWGLPVSTLDLRIDGGNLLVDGAGRCVTSEATLAENDLSEDELRQVLAHAFGCAETVIVPALEREATGHVDLFIAINAPGEALVAVAGADDPYNAEILDDSARLLRAAGFRVRRVPMPTWSDDVFRSYLNALVLDDLVIVPVFDDDPTNEAEALTILSSAFPGREIVPIVADAIAQLGGAVHCTTLSYPAAMRR